MKLPLPTSVECHAITLGDTEVSASSRTIAAFARTSTTEWLRTDTDILAVSLARTIPASIIPNPLVFLRTIMRQFAGHARDGFEFHIPSSHLVLIRLVLPLAGDIGGGSGGDR